MNSVRQTFVVLNCVRRPRAPGRGREQSHPENGQDDRQPVKAVALPHFVRHAVLRQLLREGHPDRNAQARRRQQYRKDNGRQQRRIESSTAAERRVRDAQAEERQRLRAGQPRPRGILLLVRGVEVFEEDLGRVHSKRCPHRDGRVHRSGQDVQHNQGRPSHHVGQRFFRDDVAVPLNQQLDLGFVAPIFFFIVTVQVQRTRSWWRSLRLLAVSVTGRHCVSIALMWMGDF
mmetsp:Transcript_13386/g.24971  ORF Transcript_13386/g.24971 Transcript_13386/m.24971 type:complete len:231 (+) Transcript_13386:237-929(+)